jgi:hypothetical protein
MTKTGQLPADISFADVKLRIQESYTNPNVGKVLQVVLKDGPRVFKIATMFEIRDPASGGFHHYSLRLDHIEKKKDGWFAKPERSMSLESAEVDHLHAFLSSLADGKLAGRTGDLHIIGTADYERLATVVGMLDRLPAHDRLELASAIISRIQGPGPGIEQFVRVFSSANKEVIASIAVASRLVEYEAASERLEELIEDSATTEQELQQFLQKNSWMFGSEYSELLDRRTWTRDDRLDFMLRRTVDGYLEIVEIKTPAVGALFRYDASHDSHFASSDLSRVVGQTVRYIDEVERKRDSLIAADGVDPLKIRARIIIGRDGDAVQSAALRSFNAHLSRIEVLTFDQLLRIAKQVLSVFRPTEASAQPDTPEDPPF